MGEDARRGGREGSEPGLLRASSPPGRSEVVGAPSSPPPPSKVNFASLPAGPSVLAAVPPGGGGRRQGLSASHGRGALGAMDASALERDAVQFARLAVQRDREGRYSEVVFYYKEAAQALIYAEMAGSSLERIQENINEYLERVQALHSAVQSKSTDPLKSKHQLDLERAHFLVTQAFDEDEKGNVEDAIELYTEAVDLCLKNLL